MGLFDFLKKGEEKPVAAKPAAAPAPLAAPATVANTAATPGYDSYTVASGDSLSLIAKRFYGDAMQYKRIFDANRDQIANENVIHPGQVLKIPKK